MQFVNWLGLFLCAICAVMGLVNRNWFGFTGWASAFFLNVALIGGCK